ncbi:MAG: tetratricopeptide repeat protein [Desulfobacterales bacterium]|nr:tetratricopeptide repeat protein [Desulfobacterales bacterium]
MIKALQSELLFVKGQKRAGSGALQESIDLYDKAIASDPDCSGVYLHKAIALSKQKKYSQATEVLKKAISLKPFNPAYYLYMGIISYDYNKFDIAANNFEKALDLSPDNILASCYNYLALMKLNKGSDEIYKKLGENVDNTNSEFKARLLVFCESFILQDKENAVNLEDTFFYETYLKNKDGKTGIFQNFLYKLTWLYIHVFYSLSGNQKKAYLHCLDGEAKLKKGDSDGSVIEFKRALEYLPGYDEALYQLFEIYSYKKDYQSFYEYIKELDEFKELSDILDSGQTGQIGNYLYLVSMLALFYYHTGDYDKACELFDLITSGFSDDYFHLYYMGLCHLAKNDAEQAFVYFQKSVEKINPNIAKKRLDECLKFEI